MKIKILCACNGKECEGICREQHLEHGSGKSGLCTAAYGQGIEDYRWQRARLEAMKEAE